jgi:predicted TIM-barrel fold metal-dependent hydrolase
MRGIKLMPGYQGYHANDRQMYPIYARAEEWQIPVLVHTGSSIFRGFRLRYANPLDLDDVAVDFPNLTIVMAHSGRGVWYDEAFFLARLRENVFMEVAGLPPQKLLDYFPELERLADKVIFGSDFPGGPDIKKNIDAVRALPLRDETKEKILGGNAARILGLRD